MKVPKMYKSSERYEAGVDVIYNDDSKLQYAPFIYATSGSSDGGDDGGDDGEEGDDIMVVNFDNDTTSIDKNFKELKNAVETGKIVIMRYVVDDDEIGYVSETAYLVSLKNETEGEYTAEFASVYTENSEATAYTYLFNASTETGVLTMEDIPG